MRHVLGNFGLVGWGLGPQDPLDPLGLEAGLAADRDAFDASFVAGAGASLTYGDSWDPSAKFEALFVCLFDQGSQAWNLRH